MRFERNQTDQYTDHYCRIKGEFFNQLTVTHRTSVPRTVRVDILENRN